jgi:hypothetical protein
VHQQKDDCCAGRTLSLQPDFAAQKPLIQEIIKNRGHKVIFYPKFHRELNLLSNFRVRQNSILVILLLKDWKKHFLIF